MKTPVRLSVAVLAIAVSLSGSAWSQQGGASATPQAKPHKVGLIDMAFVFKKYSKFERMREDLKGEITKSEAVAKDKATAVQELQKRMQTQLKEGSKDFTEAEKQLASMQADFEAFRRSTQRDLMKRESQIYHQTYLEATDAVGKFCKAYGYTLVIRFNREELDPENPQKLLTEMNRQVVFFQDEDDITDSVLEYLNKKEAARAGTRPAGNVPATGSNKTTAPK